MPEYTVRRQADSPTVPCPCGRSTRILSAADGGPCSLHVTTIYEAARHYHARTAEVYYILDGTGKMECDGDWFDVGPGTAVHIPAGTRHRVKSEGGVRTVVVAVPPFDPADEFEDRLAEPPEPERR